MRLSPTFDIEAPFLFAEVSSAAEKIQSLSPADRARLFGILIRARSARSVGIEIPLETLLSGEPL